MNDLLKIKANITFNEIESHLLRIKNNREIDLVLPKEIKGAQIGLLIEIIHLLITWSTLSNGKLIIDENMSDIDSDFLENYLNSYQNFLIASLHFDKGIITKDKLDIRKNIAPIIQRRINKIEDELNWKKGGHFLIPRILHSKTSFIRPFYRNKILRDKSEFSELLFYMLKNSATNKYLDTDISLIENQKEELGSLVYELIENIHWWGCRDFNKVEFSKGINGLYLTSHLYESSKLSKRLKDDKPLSEYFSNTLFKHGKTHFVEISVFDSGVGMASQFRKQELTEVEEVVFSVNECLKLLNTSAILSDYQRGFGYDSVQTIINKKGFLKVKTNGTKLYRNYISQPYKGKDDFINLSTYPSNAFLNASRGTIVTIIFPLK